jgi:hypothetical protein
VTKSRWTERAADLNFITLRLMHNLNDSRQKVTRRQRFFASLYWLILKNVIGWALIVAAFVAGPLVPGPAGLPLFLIGFALVSFPGKRRLTARALRGRPVKFPHARFVVISLGLATLLSAALLATFGTRQRLAHYHAAGFLSVAALYLLGVAFFWLLVRLVPRLLNLSLWLIARLRRRIRPWLRRHGIRLLPPRWRRRHPHEPGKGAMRISDEILQFVRRS